MIMKARVRSQRSHSDRRTCRLAAAISSPGQLGRASITLLYDRCTAQDFFTVVFCPVWLLPSTDGLKDCHQVGSRLNHAGYWRHFVDGDERSSWLPLSNRFLATNWIRVDVYVRRLAFVKSWYCTEYGSFQQLTRNSSRESLPLRHIPSARGKWKLVRADVSDVVIVVAGVRVVTGWQSLRLNSGRGEDVR
jgi:hypothetical protein